MQSDRNSDCLARKLLKISAAPGSTVKDVLSCCHDFFGRPMIVMDTSYNVLGQMPKCEIGDPIWDFQYKNSALDANTISEYYTDKMIDALFASEGAVLVDWGLLSDCPRIASVVRSSDEVLGSVGLLCPGGVYSSSDFENMDVVAQALGIVISRETRKSSSNSAIRSENTLLDVMISVLFQGKMRSQKDLDMWQSNVGTTLAPNYRVFALVPGTDSSSQSFLLAHLQKQVKMQRREIYSTICDGVFFILFSGRRALPDDKSVINDILTILQLANEYNIPFGISNSFSSLLELDTYKYQAMRAAQLCSGNAKDVLSHFYSNVVLKDMLIGGVDSMPPGCYHHPALQLLRDTDQLQGTDYYRTLGAYIFSLCSPKDTCTLLYIHRNTLTYRLSRIEEITGISLSDPLSFLHLMCCFYIQDTHSLLFSNSAVLQEQNDVRNEQLPF